MAYGFFIWLAMGGIVSLILLKVFNKKEIFELVRMPIQLVCFIFIVLSAIIEFWIDPFYDVSFCFFVLVPIISFILYRDIIRATILYATNIFLHESLWFVEGGFKYLHGFTSLQLVDYLFLPLVLVPLYYYYTKVKWIEILYIILVFSCWMVFWNLDGLPDTIFTPTRHFEASIFDMGSWIIISSMFIRLEYRLRLKK